MAPAALTRLKLRVTERCPTSCSLNPVRLPIHETVMAWFEAQKSYRYIVGEAAKLDVTLTTGSIQRHRTKHVVVAIAEDAEEPEERSSGSDKVDHLAVLQKMIAAGSRNASKWRIGPTETLKAMDMYYKLTQGSAFEALFEALSAASAGETTADLGSDDPAVLSPAEREAEASSDG